MLRVHGFYGHVRRNDLRSLAMFAGFAVAFQIVAAVTLFVPLIFLDLKHLPFFSLGYVERYAPIVFILGLGLFLHRFLRHVASVRATVAFTDVDRRTDPRLVNIIETAAIAAGLPLPKVGRIETSALNAFACGLSASTAVVVVTRGFEEALDDDELAAVVAHEIAHIKNGDIRLMAAANVLMEILVLVQRRNVLGGVGWKKALVLVFMPALLLVFGAAGVATRVAFTIARVSRLLISSSREFVADAEAVRLTHNPAALVSALRRIEGRSAVPGLSAQADAMMIDGAVEGPLASHPSIAERIAVLTRLSGDLVPAARPSPDTRPSPWTAERPGPWGAPPSRPAAAPARFLVQRVNAGVTENVFGLTPGARRVMTIGMIVMAGMIFWTMFKLGKPARPLDRNSVHTAVNAARQIHNGPAVFHGAGKTAAPPRSEAQRLAAMDPVDARCFATERYSVGDRGLRPIGEPDPRLVEAFISGPEAGSGDVVLERYLALKERSVRAVSAAPPADLDSALLAYVGTRKTMLMVVHRFFGEAGLRLMQDAYDSPADRAVLAKLRERLQEGAPALRAQGKLAREMALLSSAPADFVPCLARAAGAALTAKPIPDGGP